MTLTSRLALAAKIAQVTAELQEQRSRRTKTKDPVLAEALASLDVAIGALCRSVELLANSDDTASE